jgi:hypothetical protein
VKNEADRVLGLPLSPQSLIAEGTASFGVEVAFPGREREFEQRVPFPAAGSPSKAAAIMRRKPCRSLSTPVTKPRDAI